MVEDEFFQEKKPINTKTAVSIYFIENSGQIFVCDLNSNQIEQSFFRRSSLFGNSQEWEKIFGGLKNGHFGRIIKCILFKTSVEPNTPEKVNHLKMIKEIGYKFGYENICFVSDLVEFLTSNLLIAKKLGRKYGIGDHVFVVKIVSMPVLTGQFYLLQKQKIGWNVVAEKNEIIKDSTFEALEIFIKNCLDNFGIGLDQIKTINFDVSNFLKTDAEAATKCGSILKENFPTEKLIIVTKATTDDETDYLAFAGEYLSKVYSGEEYFNDYDCYVGNICEYKFELEVNESTIELPIHFKRLPCKIEKKVKFGLSKNFKLFRYREHDQKSQTEKILVHDFDLNINDNELTVVATLKMDVNKTILFEIRKDDDDETLLFQTIPFVEFRSFCPVLSFVKNASSVTCSVNYYKEGLQWNLKDINGNVKIPFKISFDKEIYIGDAALEHQEFLLSGIIEFFKFKNEKSQIENEEFMIKTVDGLRRTTPATILAVFIKSILKLLEETLEQQVEEITWKVSNAVDGILKNACEILKIKGERLCYFEQQPEKENENYLQSSGEISEPDLEKPIAVHQQKELWSEYNGTKASILAKYEQKFNEYCRMNREKLDQQIYDREFIELIRQINKKFDLFKSPIPEFNSSMIGSLPAKSRPRIFFSEAKKKFRQKNGFIAMGYQNNRMNSRLP
uniref:Uncharacterized protein n=1 Tax=Panagrolaimus sp. JU765 TaxID=591449 RepID=A0AC34PYW6_9BILA